MSDVCMCGHEEREHVISDAARYGVSTSDVCDRCACHTYRRSPLSAFRGKAVSFTREEAAMWLRVVSPYDARAAINGTRREIVRSAIRHARTARWCVLNACRRDAVFHYLAARILRAVRP